MQAETQVFLKNQSGTVVAIFDDWRSLSYTHTVNDRGTCRFEMNGEDNRSALFDLDGQIEVWRRNQEVELDWYREWAGFYRTNNDLIQENDKNSFVAYGFAYLDLARRAYIMWRAGTPEATKNTVAETAMKELVKENIGLQALAAGGRAYNNVMPGLNVQGDTVLGPTWEDSVEDKNLLSTLQDIGVFTVQNGDVIDFDIVGIGDATFEFRTYAGQRGLDRTQGNTDGNDPVVFSTDFGNMIIPVFSQDRTNEITAVYALGRGTDDAKQIELVQSPNRADSPWNRIEGVVNANTSGEDQSGQLIAAAEAALEEGKFDEKLSFKVLQIPNTFYGKHYTWGDLVTAQYKTHTLSKKIVKVRVTASKNKEGEDISLEFQDVPR